MEVWGSGRGCREVSESADAVDDQPTPGGLLGEVEDDAAGSSGEGRGDGVEPVAQPFRFPATGFMTGQGQHPAPGLQLGGQRDDLAPDPTKRRRPSSKGPDGLPRSWPQPFDDATHDPRRRRVLEEGGGPGAVDDPTVREHDETRGQKPAGFPVGGPNWT